MLNYKKAPYLELEDYHAPRGIQSYFIPMKDSCNIRLCNWLSPEQDKKCRGTVLLQQGYNEFIEKYYEVIDELIERNFAVVSFDWRGQGMSERQTKDGNKAYIKDFSQHDDDLKYILENVIEPWFPKPIIGIGHSMGGCLMLSALYNHKNTFDAMVLSAPMLGFKNEFLFMNLITIMSFLKRKDSYLIGSKPNMGIETPFTDNDVTSDEQRYLRTQMLIRKDPNLRMWGITTAWGLAAKLRLNQIRREGWAEQIDTNILIMNSLNDQVVDSRKTEFMAKRLKNCQIINFISSKHEILMEQDIYRRKFWKYFDEFIEAKANV